MVSPVGSTNFTSFEENNYSDHQKRWMPNNRLFSYITTRYIDLSGPKQTLCFAMNLNTKVKRKLVEDCCAGKIVSDIVNCFVGVF